MWPRTRRSWGCFGDGLHLDRAADLQRDAVLDPFSGPASTLTVKAGLVACRCCAIHLSGSSSASSRSPIRPADQARAFGA